MKWFRVANRWNIEGIASALANRAKTEAAERGIDPYELLSSEGEYISQEDYYAVYSRTGNAEEAEEVRSQALARALEML